MRLRPLFLLGPALGLLCATPPPKEDGPLTYFADHCQRCHGEMGSQYDPSLGKGKDDAWLVQEVTDMADGPGQGPLEGDALKAEVAFHRSLILKEPFVYVERIEKGVISGETLPKTAVTIVVAGKRIPAKVKDATWSATVPVSAKPKEIVVEATLGKKTTRLPLAKSSFSHFAPLK